MSIKRMKKARNKPSKKSSSESNMDNDFALNSISYENHFLSFYEHLNIAPNFIIQFPILIPFQFPFRQGTCVTYSLKRGNACTFHFSDVKTTESFTAGLVSKKALKVPIVKSRVEMSYIMSSDFDKDEFKKDEFLTDIFDEMIDLLNNLITSYIVSMKDIYAHKISKEMLEFGCIYRIIDVNDWKNEYVGVFISHTKVPYIKEELNKDDHDKIIWYANVIKDNLNPFILSEDFMLNSERYLFNGQYKEAVIYSQISVETFLETLLTQLLNREISEFELVEKQVNDTSFMKIVKHEIPKRIGGNWNPDSTGGIVGHWYRYCYVLRNRIVHGGYDPSYVETVEAQYWAKELRKYTITLIKKNKSKYPELLIYFIEKNADTT